MEISNEMLKAPLFFGITQEDLQALLNCVQAWRRQYARGAVIFQRGEQIEAFGLVLSGAVHIAKEDFWGNRTILGIAGPGEVFGESYACLGEERLEVSAVAAEETEALFIKAEQVLTGCSQACDFHKRLSRNLMAMLARKNLELTRKMGHMARRSMRDKLLSYLSAQAMRAGQAEFEIPMDRQQLADYLAVDRSAMSATLGKLRDEGILTFRKNHFCLLRTEESAE